MVTTVASAQKTCLLLGDDIAIFACANTLMQSGWHIEQLVSSHPNAARFAEQHAIQHSSSLKNIHSQLVTSPIALWISVQPLPTADSAWPYEHHFLLSHARAPISLNCATSWAILNDACTLDFAWTVSSSASQKATLLAEGHCPTQDTDTAGTLLARTYTEATVALQDLLPSLSLFNIDRVNNTLLFSSESTIDCPEHYALLDWQASAHQLARLCRSLSFDAHFNPYTLPKCIIDDTVLWVQSVFVHTARSPFSPGTLIDITDVGLRITTATEDITLKACVNAQGQLLSPLALKELFNLSKGYQLPLPTPQQLKQLTRLSDTMLPLETFWRNQCEAIKPTKLSLIPADKQPIHNTSPAVKTWSLSNPHKNTAIQSLTLLLSLLQTQLPAAFTVALTQTPRAPWLHLFFTNVLPLNLSFPASLTFTDAVTYVQQHVKTLRAHQTFSHDLLLRHATPIQLKAMTPILVNLVPTEGDFLQNTQYSIQCHFDKAQQCLHLSVATTLLADTTVRLYFEKLVTTFEVMSARLEQDTCISLSALQAPLLSEIPMMNNITVESTQKPTPFSGALSTIFEAQVREHPEDPIILRGEHAIHYAALRQAVNMQATELHQKGIVKSQLVAIFMAQGLDYIVANLSILQRGAICLPLDTSYQDEHYHYIFNDSHVRFLVTTKHYEQKLNRLLETLQLSIQLIVLDVAATPSTVAEALPAVKRLPSDLAYIIYRLNMTASPEGVMLSHQMMSKLAFSQQTLDPSQTATITLWRHIFQAKPITLATQPHQEIPLENTPEPLGQQTPAIQVPQPLEQQTSATQALQAPAQQTPVTLTPPARTSSPLQQDPHTEFLRMLAHDLRLDRSIKPPEKLKTANPTPDSILITGATGFIGAHLLQDLYKHTKATLYCLVRETPSRHLEDALIQTVDQYSLNREMIKSDRICFIKGDLSKPRLGLNDEHYYTLSTAIDAIYHCGANTNLTAHYSQLRATNVLSTIEVIKLATRFKLKSIHYISTETPTHQDKHHTVSEDFPALDSDPMRLECGYLQTKWVSEKLLSMAHKRQIPVNIFRPCWIIGNSVTGVTPRTDTLLSHAIQQCLRTGSTPNWQSALPLAPVDFVTEVITKVSLLPAKEYVVFNIVNTNTIPWKALSDSLLKLGYKLKTLPTETWGVHTQTAPPSANTSAETQQPFVAISAPCAYHTQHTQQYIQELDLSYPILSAEFAVYCLGFHADTVFFKHVKQAEQEEKPWTAPSGGEQQGGETGFYQ